MKSSTVAKFRKEHVGAIHKLLPHAVAYSAALAEGDAASCETALDALASILVGDFRLPRGRRVVVALTEGEPK